MVLIVVPKYINTGIISSQHLLFKKKLSQFTDVDVAIPLKFKSSLEGIYNKSDVRWYSEYKDLYKLLEHYEWIYLRSPASFAAIFVQKVLHFQTLKIFYDFRSLSYVEAPYLDKSLFKKAFLFILEFLAFHCSSARSAVSNNLLKKVNKVFGKKRISVIPCYIEEVKELSTVINAKKDYADIRFVYVGSLSKWQCIDQILDIYFSISEKVSSSFTIITRERAKAQQKVNEKGVKDCKVISLPHNKVMSVLPTFDFGFLIREDIPINNLASPIKFLEYTSNGVIPILSNNIGDYSEEVLSRNIGIVVNDNEIDVNKLEEMKGDTELISRLLEFSKGYKIDNFIENHPLANNH